MTASLQIESRVEGNHIGVLVLAGEVDVSNASQVREEALKLIAGGVKNLVVDLHAVEYMDSSGLGTLVGLFKRLKENGGTIAIAAPQPQVQRLFEITGLKQIIPCYADVTIAVKEVG